VDQDTERTPRSGPRETPYQAWQRAEGLPISRGAYVADLYALEVAPWSRIGQNGAFVNRAEQEQDDAWVIEVAPGARPKSTPPVRGYLGFGRDQPQQIEYEEEAPSIYDRYACECARSGAEVVLPRPRYGQLVS